MKKEKTALVTNKDVFFGICRMVENYMGGSQIECKAFRDTDEAIEWLEGDGHS